MSKVEHNPSRRPTLAEPQWVFITPEMAKELVSVEGTNRKIRQSVVEQYTSEMEDGMWHYSPHGSAEKVAFKAIDNVLDRIRHQVRPKFITSTP